MKIKNLLKPDNWWILILSGVIAYMLFMIYSEPEYNKAFNFILPGLSITFLSTFISFLIATIASATINFLCLKFFVFNKNKR